VLLPLKDRYRITGLGRRNASKRPITAAMTTLDQVLDALLKEAKLAPCEI